MKNARLDRLFRQVLAWGVGVVVVLALASQVGATEVEQLNVERSEEGVYLSAIVRFDLPLAVEDALLKGIPMFFVAEADVFRDRWYWYDKRVTTATRTMRLAFQPLTRRWRLNVLPGAISVTGLRASFSQNYDSLPDAIASIQRFSRWRIADAAEVEPDASHKVEFRFRLDLSQLPRPFQIGMAGQKDWTIAVETSRQLVVAPIRDPQGAAPREVARELAKDASK